MADYPLIQGVKYDHSSAEIQVLDTLFTGISAINWSQSLTPGIGRGTRAEKLFRTVGEHDANGDMTLPLEDYAELIATLGNGYMAIPFPIVVTYSNEGQNVTTVELVGCRIVDEGGGSESGGDPAEVEVSLDIMRAVTNGILPVPNMLV